MSSKKNDDLHKAKRGKNDEFYTQLEDIEKEMYAYLEFDPDVFRGKTILLPCDDPEWSNFTKFFTQNFELLGIKKLISTSYAKDSKPCVAERDEKLPLLYVDDPKFDSDKESSRGKVFVLTENANKDGKIDLCDFDWKYLEGDGDYRSDEVTKLRDEADIIVTNPPFSLFRDFLAWIAVGGKKFSIVGNMNAVTYRGAFPLVRDNKMWYGPTISSGDREFRVPENYPLQSSGFRTDDAGNKFIRVKGVRWFTNIEHGRRHEKLELMTMADNLKRNKKVVRGTKPVYREYDNYDAIEVSFTSAIPSDYDGVMGVPISFLDKYSPEQFEILGMGEDNGMGYSGGVWRGGSKSCLVDGVAMFKRIFIRHINAEKRD